MRTAPHRPRRLASTLLLALLLAGSAGAEVMLQWFETEWDEIYRRLPEVAEAGYDYLWLPPPTKGPTGQGTKWGNVGYSLYDRFDLGDVPQRGSLATRYGTRGSLRNMVDQAHQCDVGIIPDIVMNHNGNGPDFRTYPGMKPEDFHVQWEANHCNTLNYKRGPRMGEWYHGEGYGGTMWQELVNLIDIRTEPDNRFTGGSNTPGWNLVAGASYLRHPGQYDRYPYYPGGYGAENAARMLNRWIAWLGDAMDYDGLRLDAGKHVPHEFFGTRGSGFLHEAQWNYNARRGYGDGSPAEADELFTNYLGRRDDALIFAEILSYQSELAYWFGGALTGVANNTRNPMRFLDYPLKQKLFDAFSNGNLGALAAGGGGIDSQLGIMYAWGHDEAGPSKINLAYAYVLTHIGFPMVYFTGNNITWADNNTRTWMRPGYDSQALGDQYNDIPNLLYIHQQFARGREYDRWNENDFFAYERYDDRNGSGGPDAGEGLLLVALNDSGWDQTRNNVTVSFPAGTVLHDYTGHNPGDITVYNNGGLAQVNVTVPGNSGQGWVCYAPRNADGAAGGAIRLQDGGSPAGTLTWIVPGGVHAASKTREIARLTAASTSVDVFFDPKGGAVDSVMLKWGQGGARLTATNAFDSGNSLVSGGYEKCSRRNATNWFMNVDLDAAGIPEGLNVIRARVFSQRDASLPALFNTFTKVVYVDRRGPELQIENPSAGESVTGDTVAVIRNPDYTAYGMTVSVDGGAPATAHEIMKGLWKFNLAGLSSGNHTMAVACTEADWDSPRQVIHTSVYARAFSVAANPQSLALSHAEGSELKLPFFRTGVTAPGSPARVRLYWDGYELPFNAGGYSNAFNGEVIFRDNVGNVVTDRLWGAFCNGQHFLEAERVDGSVTSRVSRRVAFNLYGVNAIDSDGDALPDNVEMPGIDTDGAPGPDAPWPGDSNKDFVPNNGETWTRLNPYNHSTFYSGQWDDRGDFDGDGYANGDEVLAGYYEGNLYKYGIYNSASHPSGTPAQASEAVWSPTFARRGQTLNITYRPYDGPLKGESPVVIHIGHSLKTRGAWQDVADVTMTASGSEWTYAYPVPTNATSVDFVFRNSSGARWDNHGGADWQAQVEGSSTRYFNMNGAADSENYLVFPDGMKLYAAVKGENLYVATWGVSESGGANDHFIFVTDEPGDASDPAPGWGKQGRVFMDTAHKPFLAAEGENGWEGWSNVTGNAQNAPGGLLEGEFNLADAFGSVPEAVYIAAAAYQTWSGGGLTSQGPYAWDAGNTVDPTEFLRVPVASIRDDDQDGYFDGGKPQMWTVVNGNTNDANYGLRRLFLNELAGDAQDITVILKPNAAPGAALSSVELFSNLNRRDFARIEEDPASVTAASADTYYRAYPMTALGDGRYQYTVRVAKCGAYRINARYRVNGGAYVYYTDHGLRRDCAVVVSPKKALDAALYELNPLTAEASSDDFYGRSTFRDMHLANTNRADFVNTAHFTALGLNMLWLQPIHPIGGEGRQTDPDTGLPYDPGSPYAVRNYWKVNGVLGDPSTEAQALQEFTGFVGAMDAAGVGVMLDGTFNHSAWDCEIGEMGVTMGIATDPSTLIRHVRPQWYSKKGRYGEHATHYESGGNHDIAMAPDRVDFGKWTDAADFFFGRYDCLVQGPVSDTNNASSSPWYQRYLFEEDRFDGHDAYTRELWQYFAAYPLYWLEKTGHPAGTPAAESWRGIDGLRCDFAQGLPSPFWEYCINRTRSVKWDFLFMAESLDGNREIGGSKRHGVGYRSSRHFDILNENMVFYWRDQFFNYPQRTNPQPYTYPTWQAFDARRQAFDASPILLNLTSHDEIYPAHDPYRVFYAYCQLAAMDGVPMLFYGQEAGAQNDYRTDSWIPNADHNFARYETNFGKSIPNFKRYNHMLNVWNHRDWTLQGLYGRVNGARQRSAALRSQGVYFLSRTDSGAYDPNIFAVAKYEQAGVSAATQDVVFVFVDNNYWGNTNRWATFRLNATVGGRNWFGIEAGRSYNLVNLASSNASAYVWGSPVSGADLVANGITVGLTGSALRGERAQYLKLVDTAVGPSAPDADGDGVPDYTDWDDDDDGLPDTWERAHGLNPLSAAGVDGAGGDKDGDGAPNADELAAGTDPGDRDDVLAIRAIAVEDGTLRVCWPAKEDRRYRVERGQRLTESPVAWQALGGYRTPTGAEESASQALTPADSNAFYRVKARP